MEAAVRRCGVLNGEDRAELRPPSRSSQEGCMGNRDSGHGGTGSGWGPVGTRAGKAKPRRP